MKAAGGPDAERQAVEDATVRLPMDQLVGALNEHVSVSANYRLLQAGVASRGGSYSRVLAAFDQ